MRHIMEVSCHNACDSGCTVIACCRVYFDACDGFFTNYSWIEPDLDESMEAAGERRHDVFIGMDVWGRNFHGGGMFNLQEVRHSRHTLRQHVTLMEETPPSLVS